MQRLPLLLACACCTLCVLRLQVSTLQEVDEQKEAANELLVR